MNKNKDVAEKVFEEVLKSQLIEDDYLKECDFTPCEFYSFFDEVMNYAGEKDLTMFKCDYYSMLSTYVEYKGKLFLFSEVSGEFDSVALSIELCEDKNVPKLKYEDFETKK